MVLFADIYSSQLWRYGHGMPLWSPEPVENEGEVRIGDVGHVDEDGQFHRLFNVTVSAEHPINGGATPDNFELLHWPEQLIYTQPNCLEAGPIVSEGVKSAQVSAGVSA